MSGSGLAIVADAVVFIALWLIVVTGRGAASGDSDGGGGGLERPPPDRPNGGGGPAEPGWWPEFEREFARYLVQRERANTGGDRPRVNR
jgi:hypothetical protein